MGGKPREALDYASIPTSLFNNDARIDKLLDAQGWRGVGVYMYLLLRAYGSHGYYLEWCFADCATIARKMGGGIGATQVEEAIRCCLRVGLFDEGLLVRWGVLTSIDIQTNFLEAKRRLRHRLRVRPEIWLLNGNVPSSGLVPCAENTEEMHKDSQEMHKDSQEMRKDKDSRVGKGIIDVVVVGEPEKAEAYAKAADLFGSIKGAPLSPFEIDRTVELVDDYGLQWVLDALRNMGDHGVVKINYAEATLANWRSNGRSARSKPISARPTSVKRQTDEEYEADVLRRLAELRAAR